MALPIDVKNAISKQVPKILKKDLLLAARVRTEIIKKEIIAEFLSHPVTVEILEGPDADNSSGLLSGSGNLFSFIGFDRGDRPIEPILDLLQQIRAEFIGFTSSGINVLVTIPEPKDVFEATPMPWAPGRSWARGVETGISGLGQYLPKKSQSSRSGSAIQSKNKVVGGVRFKNTKYISALINKYKKIIQDDTVLSP